jgi:MEMO1 family protein
MYRVRPAAIAGSFYPGLKQVLQQDVSTMLADVAHPASAQVPKAIIVPHAGYMYSGQIAAAAYARLADARKQIRRVVLLGPVHRVPVRGLALPEADAFVTPLGEVMLDKEAVQAISSLPQVVVSGAAHAMEHSLEVQLPFLQSVLDDFRLVPLAVGDANAQEVADVLDALWGGKETLIVISSDLSHFLPYHVAQKIDQQTAQQIVDMHGPISHEQACGGTPINGFLLSARRHHLRPSLLDIRNSGDTAGDKSRVVGYAAFAFMEDDDLEDGKDVH